MDEGQTKQAYLMEEVLRLKEASFHLRARFLDRFVKEPAKESSSKVDAVKGYEPNPIDECISITQETRGVVEYCHKLLEEKIIMKLEGK